jgi:hypothetical protein
MTQRAKPASRRGSKAVDQAFGKFAEDVDVGDFPPLFRLDGAFGDAVDAYPGFEVLAQADDVQKRLLHHEATQGDLAMVGVEVAVDGDAAALGESDRFPDLAALEIALAEICYLASASRMRRLSICNSR